jgi:tRNA threonylcarbamoyladenosine biosynthesis protein TsaE
MIATVVHLQQLFTYKTATCSFMKRLFSIHELESEAKYFITLMADKSVVAFHGQMGAGKTTFIGALCRLLGTHDVTGSPTFSIINQYNTVEGKIIYHMDLYRIKDEEEAINAGVEDALYSGNLCLVEWPEHAEGLLPDDTFHVTLTAVNKSVRELSVPEY